MSALAKPVHHTLCCLYRYRALAVLRVYFIWLQGDTAVFEVDMMVDGDIVLGLWQGDTKGPWDAPACAYAFHTAFADAGLLRVSALDMDFPDWPGDHSGMGFHLEVTLEEHTRTVTPAQRHEDQSYAC